MQGADPWMLVWIVAGSYLVFGLAAAWIGLSVGRKSLKLKETQDVFNSIERKDFFETSKDQQFRIIFLFLHIVGIPVGLYLINYASIWITLGWYAVYLGFCLLYYRNAMRRLKKPVFWFQLFMITLLAAIFWSGFNLKEGIIDMDGLQVGLEMNLRAIYLVISFSSLSVELRNPRIKDFLFGKGFGNLYQSLGLAFSALPSMMRTMPRPKAFFRNPLTWFARINQQAGLWLREFEKQK